MTQTLPEQDTCTGSVDTSRRRWIGHSKHLEFVECQGTKVDSFQQTNEVPDGSDLRVFKRHSYSCENNF